MSGKIIRFRRPDVVILVNHEHVLYESLELARLKIANTLKIPLDKVSVTCEIGNKGRLRANFTVDVDAAKEHSPERVNEVVKIEYAEARARVQSRFAGLGELRHGDG